MVKKNPRRIGTVERNIWDSMYEYPSMYEDAASVLHHMFIVIGNGTDWIDGKLVYHREKPRSNSQKMEKPFKKQSFSACRQLDLQHEIEHLRRNRDTRFVLDNIDLLSRWHDRRWKSIYPLSKYSAIVTIPPDANKSHQKYARIVIDKIYEMLFYYPNSLSYTSSDGTAAEKKRQSKANHLRNVKWADYALNRVDKMFGKREGRPNGYQRWRSFAGYVRFKRKIHGQISKTLSDILAT